MLRVGVRESVPGFVQRSGDGDAGEGVTVPDVDVTAGVELVRDVDELAPVIERGAPASESIEAGWTRTVRPVPLRKARR